ncbi:MAG: AAA family ATPase, partial [Paludibacteraceae bacterium]|nr:AAA family ATPase [Paludibacteraceae bacterium]
MGLYLNPNAEALKQSLRNEIYVDKSLILAELNKIAETDHDFVCMSRPRRFGKSMAGNMISAYYSKGCDTRDIFAKMILGQVPGFDKNLNKFNVIKLDLNGLYQTAVTKDLLIAEIDETLREEFVQQFPSISFKDTDNIVKCISRVYNTTNEKFVIIIDEYDVLVREQVPDSLFQSYLSF